MPSHPPRVHRLPLLAALALFFALVATASPHGVFAEEAEQAKADAQAFGSSPEQTRDYIVVLEDFVKHPGAVAEAQSEQRDGELGFVYRHALKGYTAELPKSEVEALREDPRVRMVTPDHKVETFAQAIPTGIERIYAPTNADADIDGNDDARVNVDVAVIDTGVDLNHDDLNVFKRTYCNLDGEAIECVDGTGNDSHGHGTHVAGTIGAIDNGEGVVGVAPGARIWAVKVLDPIGWESEVIAGIDWVTQHADQIEVANMSLGCVCPGSATDLALKESAEEGVVYAVAAGNSAVDAKYFSPASSPDVITVSALADFDGLPGDKAGESSCRTNFEVNWGTHDDDSLAAFSNWGSTVEIAAPGVCILSSVPGDEYEMFSGTSMASPHVAGAAALLASKDNPETEADVEDIRDTLIERGNFEWTDSSGDVYQEPLLDVGNGAKAVVAPQNALVKAPGEAVLRGLVNPGGVATKYHFEYGTSTAYGTSVPVPSVSVGSGSGYVAVEEELEGLQENTKYHFRLVATNSKGTFHGPDRAFWPTAPGVSTEAASSVGPLTTVLNAKVNPRGHATTYQFEWGTTTSYGNVAPVFAASVGSGTEDVEVAKKIAGLQPGTTYHYRVVATSTTGAAYGEDMTFTYDPADVVAKDPEGNTCTPCIVEFKGFYRVNAWGLNYSECNHEFDLVVFGNGRLEASGHSWSEGVNPCSVEPCTGGEDATWNGLITEYEEGVAVAAIEACMKEAGNESFVLELEFEPTPEGAWLEAALQPMAFVDDEDPDGKWKIEGEWSSDDVIELVSYEAPDPEADPDTDVDGDGHADLIATDSDGTAQVFAGNENELDAGSSTASLSEALDPALLDGKGNYVIDSADVDGDGRSDLVTIDSAGAGVSVHRGKENGTFATAVKSLAEVTPSLDGWGMLEPIGAGDVNGDGRADLVGHIAGSVGIFPGKADGTFGSFVWGPSVDSALFDASGHYFVDLADVNDDGYDDLLTINTNGTAYVFKGQSDGKLASPTSAASIDPIMDNGTGQEPVGAADVNSDGKADLITLSGTTLKFWAGKADGTFAASSNAYGSSIDSDLMDGSGLELIGLLDHDGDHDGDLVALNSSGDLLTYRAEGNGTFVSTITSEGSIDSVRGENSAGIEFAGEQSMLRRPGCIASGCQWRSVPTNADVNGEGRADLAALDPEGTAQVFAGNASGISAASPTASLSKSLDPALLDGEGDYVVDNADVNGDGRSDLVTVDSAGAGVLVHLGKGNRTYAAAVLSLKELNPNLDGSGFFEPIAVADVDGDGRGDLVGQLVGSIGFFPGKADATFGSFVWGPSADSALFDASGNYFIDLADLNLDGKADLVAMNTDGKINVFSGKASGAFTAANTSASANPILDNGAGEEPIGLADVTGDGKADLLTLDGSTLKLRQATVPTGISEGAVLVTFGSSATAYGSSIDSDLLDGGGLELIGLLDHSRDGRADLIALNSSGDLLAYAGKSDGTFASPTTSEGSIESVRGQNAEGLELANEKPLLRRAGCDAEGCELP